MRVLADDIDGGTIAEMLAPHARVLNVHAVDIDAAPDAVFETVQHHYFDAGQHAIVRALFRTRGAIGRVLRLERGGDLRMRPPPLAEGATWAGVFTVERVDPPHEIAIRAENTLTRAILSYALRPQGGRTRLYEITRADFIGTKGKLYWLIISRFHDYISEDKLRRLKRYAESMPRRASIGS